MINKNYFNFDGDSDYLELSFFEELLWIVEEVIKRKGYLPKEFTLSYWRKYD